MKANYLQFCLNNERIEVGLGGVGNVRVGRCGMGEGLDEVK